MNTMKLKAVIFILITVLLLGGAIYANSQIKDVDTGLTHSLYTISGDESALEGVEAGLSYTVDQVVFKSRLDFTKDGIKEETITEKTRGDQGWFAYEFYSRYSPYGNYSDIQKLEIWLYDHYGEFTNGIKVDKRGYFYRRSAEELEPGILPGYFFDSSGWTEDYKNNIEKQELPKGNGIYTIDYKAKKDADYIVDPDMSTTRLLMEFDEDCVIRKMGFSMEKKYLEVLYTKDGDLRFRAMDLETEKTVCDMDLFREKDAAASLVVYFPEQLKAEGESDITLIGCDTGLIVLRTGNGEFDKVIDRTFTKDDSPKKLGRYLDHSPNRSTKAYFDGKRLVFLSRVVKTDNIYPEHKGIHLMVFEGKDLEYSGVITSPIYSSDEERLYDAYAEDYIEYMTNDGWIYPDDDEIDWELNDVYYYNNYVIEYVKG